MDIYSVRQLLRTKSIYDINLRVAYYARVSTDSAEQLNSLKNQHTYYDDFIKSNKNWVFCGGYIDEGMSAKDTKKRDNFLKMVQDGLDGKFDFIITKEISRFARNTLDSIKYTRQLLDNGVAVFFQSDAINTLDADSELRLTIMSGVAQDEIRKLSSRVHFGNQRSIESGRVLGNSRIFGYEKSNGKLIINEKEAEMVRKIYKWYVGGYSSKQIEDLLYNDNYRSRAGTKIGNTTVCNIIQNPKYKGYYCGNKVITEDLFSQKKRYNPKSEWRVYKDEENVPPIIDEKTWEEANQILDNRSWTIKNRGGSFKQDNLFTGKIVCEMHNVHYYLRPKKIIKDGKEINKNTWKCSHKLKNGSDSCLSFALKETELLNIIDNELRLINDDGSIINSYLELYNESKNIKMEEAKLSALKKEVEKHDSKKDKLLELSLEGLITNDDFYKRNKLLCEQIESINIQIDDIEKTIKAKQSSSPVEVKEKIKQWYNDNEFKLTQRSIDDVLDKIYVTSISDTECILKIKLKILGETVHKYNKDIGIIGNRANTDYLIEERSDVFSKLKYSKRSYRYTRIEPSSQKRFNINYTTYLVV